MARIMVVTKYSLSEVKRLLHPRAVIPVRVGRRMIADEVIRNTLGFVLFYVSIFVGVSVVLTAMGFDLVSALGATAASIGNVGPGLRSVGPSATMPISPIWPSGFSVYACFSGGWKSLLSLSYSADHSGNGRGAKMSTVLKEAKERCGVITVNRPEVLNAVNQKTMEELKDAFMDFRRDSGVGVIILTGAGEKSFIAGADITEMSSASATEAVELIDRW